MTSVRVRERECVCGSVRGVSVRVCVGGEVANSSHN